MGQYVSVYFSPAGRISQIAFLVYFVPVGIALAVSGYFMCQLSSLSQPLVGFFFFMLWPKFCLMSRRLQDSGIPGVLALPLIVLSAVNFLIWLDPSMIGETAESFEENWAIFSLVMYVCSRLTGLVFTYGCCIRGSDEGPNGYGPPFGAMGKMTAKKQQRIRDRVLAEHGHTAAGRELARMAQAEQLAHAYEAGSREEQAGSKLGFPDQPRRAGFGRR